MTLTLYNTLTRKKEPFRPIDARNVRMYVCGPTVYDFAHIGNARPVIVFDVLFRLLRHIYGPEHVTYARNITDVDDKINARAAEEYPDLPLNEAIRQVTEKTEKQFHEDIAALGVLTPEDVNKPGQPPVFVEPRATEHIAEMRRLCEMLVANEHAYVAQEHVLFDVASMPDYGRLSNRSLDEMEAGARVEVAPYKRGPMDFVLWKPSKPGEPAWGSPASIAAPGRPGWHLECSAMADRWLWEEARPKLSAAGLASPHVFDIHGGGIDLVFPHHENEIAQSRCAHGTAVMANYWMHNGFLQVEGEKMSKSLGNFVTIRELLRTKSFGGRVWPGEVLRLAMLMTHYREPINWSVERLIAARRELADWTQALIESPEKPYPVEFAEARPYDLVVSALSEDLNTPLARTHLQGLCKLAVSGEGGSKKTLAATLSWLGLYRRRYHFAYSDQLVPSNNVKAEFIRKHHSTVLDARADLLNSYRLPSESAAVEAAEASINGLDKSLERDGVRLRIRGFCELVLEPVVNEAKQDVRAVETLIAARSAARTAKNFKEADRIREELTAMGIQLKDAKDPKTGEIVTTWEVKR